MKVLLMSMPLLMAFAIPNAANAGCRGCGCRGGPGWRKANGQCASWADGGGGNRYYVSTSTYATLPTPKKKTPTEAERKAKFKWALMYMNPETNLADIEYKFFTNTTDKPLVHQVLKAGDWTCSIQIDPVELGGTKYNFDKQSAKVECKNHNGFKFYNSVDEYAYIDSSRYYARGDQAYIELMTDKEEYNLVSITSCHRDAKQFKEGICSWKK